MFVEWWIWLLLGLFLLLGEILTPGGFFILFFGLGAILIGLLTAVDVIRDLWIQCLLFSLISVSALLVFRRPLMEMMRLPAENENVDSLVGETAVVLEEIGTGAIGKAEMRGTSWSARNIGARPLGRGERCKVERVDGLMLSIRPE